MKNINYVGIGFMLFISCEQQDKVKQIDKVDSQVYDSTTISHELNENKKIDTIEVETYKIDSTYIEPQFPGGEAALANFIKRELKMPDQVKFFSINNTVCVNLRINRKGKVYSKEIIMEIPLCPQCHEEALRVVSKMPDWIPSIERDKNGNVIEIIDGETVVCFDFK